MRPSLKAFTLMELLITITIILVVSSIGAISLNSRLAVASLEEAAQSLAADLSYARTAALFKGCPTRFVFCGDKLCTQRDIAASVGGPVTVGGENAQVYAIIRRMAHGAAGDCSTADADPDAGAANAFTNFDYDRKPQEISSRVSIDWIYDDSTAANFQDDYADETASEAEDALWFATSISDPQANQGFMNLPVSTPLDADGNFIVFQLSLASCDPSVENDDCAAYFVTIDSSGQTGIRACLPGGRAGNGNTCF